MNEKYSEIINSPHPQSQKHEPMDKGNRAAQFAPYSALSGYEDAVDETARLTDGRIELDEYEKERINATLTELIYSQNARATITYFRPDERKNGGAYITVTGELYRIDEQTRSLTLVGGYSIPIDEIFDVKMCKNQTNSDEIV